MTRVKISSRPVELFGLAEARDFVRQRQRFQQRHDIDAAGLQHGARLEVDLVQLEPLELVGDVCAGPGQEAGAHAIGLRAEPQIEARRLDLVGVERRGADCAARPTNSAAISLSGKMPAVVTVGLHSSVDHRLATPG